MNWFRRLRPETTEGEGKKALERTKAERPEVERQAAEAVRLGQSLRRLREENHFAENVARVLRGNQ
jgi:hypothetical protein